MARRKQTQNGPGKKDPALALYGPIAGAQASFVVAQVGQSP